MKLTFGQLCDLAAHCRTLHALWPISNDQSSVAMNINKLDEDKWKELSLACQSLSLFSETLDKQQIMLAQEPPQPGEKPKPDVPILSKEELQAQFYYNDIVNRAGVFEKRMAMSTNELQHLYNITSPVANLLYEMLHKDDPKPTE